MPLSWNEMRNRAISFSERWRAGTSEIAESKPFWTEFFQVFGIDRKRVAAFEQPVSKLGGKRGFIDLFWKGTLLIEHKSRGKDLDKAFDQALDYFPGIKERDLPKFVLVSDFARFRLYDLEAGTYHEFGIEELQKNIKHFAFVAGYRTQIIKPQDPVNINAAERMGKLHDSLKESKFAGHPLEVLLVRLMFCLFAEDTGIFQPSGCFRYWIEQRTAEDGSDLGAQLANLFQALNTPEADRSTYLDELINAFPFVNGQLFEEQLPIANFNASMRESLLDCCDLDWGAISPAIFGALFQSVMDPQSRRNQGAHYTSEENILKLIKPLFLDKLRKDFDCARKSTYKLLEFHKTLRSLTFFDPACGCGNFLVVAYRELRLLELDVLRAVAPAPGQQQWNIHAALTMDVDQFYGIELEEFAAQIARVALRLVDHQMNVRVSEEFGMYFARVPLKATARIVHGNALLLDWNTVLPADRAPYVFGNPPFVGAKFMSDRQRSESRPIFASIHNGGLLDYVAAWFVKAADYISNSPSASVFDFVFTNDSVHRQARRTHCAFVSTNSITQGEQVGVLWGYLLSRGIHIHFAHRTFQWNNEATGVAAVHCVIIGFGLFASDKKLIFEYEDIRGVPREKIVGHISPYLVDAPNVVLQRRNSPLCDVPVLGMGNQPIDGGHFLFSDSEKSHFLSIEPQAEPFFRRWVGAEEFINRISRWCLWLGETNPHELRAMPACLERVNAVRRYRLQSRAQATRKLADSPTRFNHEFMPESAFLVIPEVSSERREFIPIGHLRPPTLASNKLRLMPGASLFHFAILSSSMHMAWTRAVCGRLKSDYQYSTRIVYNNFPWPIASTKQRISINSAAQSILRARDSCPEATLADLYDPLAMPRRLRKAHVQNDVAVDTAYGYKGDKSDASRVAFLFDLYAKLVQSSR
ncbi:MAG: hypothetical protein FWD57_15695 [Polyangiaceae bacterium]|nr:hypothetical protein [Polyangiaceae bacterium]